MKEYIAIILMILPGFLVRKIKEIFRPTYEIKSELEKTIISLVYSLPILFINLVFLLIFKYTYSIAELIKMFDDVFFIILYFIITFISTSIVTISIICIKPEKKMNIINKIREVNGEPKITNSTSPWEDFLKNGEEKPVEVLRDNKVIAKGFVKHWDLDGRQDKDIVLVHTQDMIDNSECFTEIKGEYIDLKNNIVIREYYFDTSKIKKYTDQSNKDN